MLLIKLVQARGALSFIDILRAVPTIVRVSSIEGQEFVVV